MPLYGGAPAYMITALQCKLTEAMRVVTRRRWEVAGCRLTFTAELLRICGYLSVRKMIYFYSVAAVHKVLVHQAPVHLHQVLSRALATGHQPHQYNTRTGGWRQVAPARLAAADSSWRWRAAAQYAALPAELRGEENLPRFLAGLRRHTTRTVGI